MKETNKLYKCDCIVYSCKEKGNFLIDRNVRGTNEHYEHVGRVEDCDWKRQVNGIQNRHFLRPIDHVDGNLVDKIVLRRDK